MSNANGNGHVTAAYQGERGAFSEAAAHRMFGKDVKAIPYRTFEEIFEAVSTSEADCAVVPIENSLAGSVHKNYDLLMEHELTIIAETKLRIIHNLIALPGATLADVRRVYSHPVALAQCEKFLRANPQIEVVPSHDTAGSVRLIFENGRREEAAIAGNEAASVYGAEILAQGIEDNRENFTRFLLLTRQNHVDRIAAHTDSSKRKTSIVFRVANRPGALFRSLAVFALRDIDLMKIESRPIEGRPWEYSFYLDLAGDWRDPAVARALDHLAELAESVRMLGSYSAASQEQV
jgi:prephenate dehydratase